MELADTDPPLAGAVTFRSKLAVADAARLARVQVTAGSAAVQLHPDADAPT